MDWKAYGQKIGLPVDGAMGDYYRPQIEEAMRNEANRASMLGNQPGYQANVPGGLQGGNDMGALVQGTNQAAGRMGPGPMSIPTTQPGPTMTTQAYQPAPQPGGAAAPFTGAGGPGPGGGFSPNPYLPQMANDITRRVNEATAQQMNNIGRGAVANGTYGSSRTGIAQGLAAKGAADVLSGNLANLYGNQFNTDRNYGLQSDALDLNVFNANQNWMQQGAMNQLSALDKMLGWNQQYGIGNTTNVQNTPLNYWQQFANTGSQMGGLGGSQSQNMPGNPWLGAIGGYQLGKSLFGG